MTPLRVSITTATPLALAAANAHAHTRQYRERVAEARVLIRDALTISRSPYVSFSCGKDSTSMADLVLGIAPDVPLVFLSSGETRLLHNVDDVLTYFRNRGATINEINIDRVFSDAWRESTWHESRKAGVGDLQRMAEGHDCSFIGLRAEESKRRRFSLYYHRTDGLPRFLYRMADGRLRACPMARWRTADIHAHIVTRDLPLLDAYREEGIKTRTTARLTGTAVRMGALARLREHHRDRYNALIARWPELAAWA